LSGIKDLHGLLFWLDNSKEQRMSQVLANKRKISRERASIMRDLGLACGPSSKNNAHIVGNKPAN
jgi:hypothetical protein